MNTQRITNIHEDIVKVLISNLEKILDAQFLHMRIYVTESEIRFIVELLQVIWAIFHVGVMKSEHQCCLFW